MSILNYTIKKINWKSRNKQLKHIIFVFTVKNAVLCSNSGLLVLKICISAIILKGKRRLRHLLSWQHHSQNVNPFNHLERSTAAVRAVCFPSFCTTVSGSIIYVCLLLDFPHLKE